MSTVLDNNTKAKFPRKVSLFRLKTKFFPGKVFRLASSVLSALNMKVMLKSAGHDHGEERPHAKNGGVENKKTPSPPTPTPPKNGGVGSWRFFGY